MQTEFEATFYPVEKAAMREKLRSVGAKLVKSEFLQKRKAFSLPAGHEIEGGWLRVRDEQDKITLSLKVVNGSKIEDQKELELKVDSFEKASDLLTAIGCRQKAYQENRRERWDVDGADVVIDEWPYLEPLIEIEAESEEKVRAVAEKLGFDYSQAFFGTVAGLYSKKYGITEKQINDETPMILFDMEKNPFEK